MTLFLCFFFSGHFKKQIVFCNAFLDPNPNPNPNPNPKFLTPHVILPLYKMYEMQGTVLGPCDSTDADFADRILVQYPGGKVNVLAATEVERAAPAADGDTSVNGTYASTTDDDTTVGAQEAEEDEAKGAADEAETTEESEEETGDVNE